jgi:hypothetical protein
MLLWLPSGSGHIPWLQYVLSAVQFNFLRNTFPPPALYLSHIGVLYHLLGKLFLQERATGAILAQFLLDATEGKNYFLFDKRM